MKFWFLTEPETIGVIIGVLFGIISRLMMLRTDYRQYPTYPHGKVIHFSLAVIAAGLGAILVPALLNKNYTAVTFLTVAAQQFRDVRNMERQSLEKVDEMELVPRGTAYIEGIAMVFEGRNYLVIFSSFVAAFFAIIFQWYWGIITGLLSLFIAKIFQSGKNLGQIAEIREAVVRMEGPDLFVDSIYIMNVGLPSNQQIIREHGRGLIVKPSNKNVSVTIANLGQRQAILHNLSTILGIYRDSGEPALVPMTKLNLDSGELAVFILPQINDIESAKQALRHVPVLENAVRMPSESSANKKGGKTH
ncbi:YIEGIA family protein [Brevibacillus ruminantium]|uniref:YIEGIA family protein n=1 Tax=Brevibacillus ruminantium TaxID=2950604 RepID=A0ABY4W8B5_9BACL|nr:YIEGIA family protein [Brevibacillus ruminantium]USG63303.1 YIEGIA family protein [Brevibacillus ruminantium]